MLKSQIGNAHLSLVLPSTLSIVPSSTGQVIAKRSADNTPLWSAEVVLASLPAGAKRSQHREPFLYANISLPGFDHITMRVLGHIDDLDLSVSNLVTGAATISHLRTGDGDRRLCLSIQRFAVAGKASHMALAYGRTPSAEPYGWDCHFVYPGKPGMIGVVDLERAYQEAGITA